MQKKLDSKFVRLTEIPFVHKNFCSANTRCGLAKNPSPYQIKLSKSLSTVSVDKSFFL